MLIEKPARYIVKNALTMLIGIAMTGMSVARQSRRNAKMMKATSANATPSVSSTSRMERRTFVVKSYPISATTSLGSSALTESMRR